MNNNNNNQRKKPDKREKQKREVEIVDIDGIPYYIDAMHNVYQHETILSVNPAIIGRWEWLSTGGGVHGPKRRFIQHNPFTPVLERTEKAKQKQ